MSAEGNPRVAIGEELRAKWIKANTAGLDLGPDIGIHLGFYDEERPMPQVALTDVSSTAQGNNGKAGWHASGSGHFKDYIGRVDANVWTGTVDDVPDGEDPDLLAETIGNEVHDIMHAAEFLTDPVTGDLLCSDIGPLSKPDIQVDTDGAMAEYRAIVELQYRMVQPPPDR